MTAKIEPVSHDNIAAAFVGACAELTNPKRSAKVEVPTKSGGKFSYTYAPLDSILAEVRPILARHGLAIRQDAVTIEGGTIGVKTVLLHESGQTMETGLLTARAPGDMKDLGGTVTYARRYQLTAFLGLAAEEDLDASGDHRAPEPKKAAKPEPKAAPSDADQGEAPAPAAHDDGSGVTDPQRKAIFAIAKKLELSEEGLHRVIAGRFEVESVNDLTKAQASSLIDDMQKMKEEAGG